ncbi:5137_t:CDS:2, partial [Cetraspora pellucida]
TLPEDQKERIETILDKNPDLFAKSISELGNLVEARQQASNRTQKAQQKQRNYHDSKHQIESYGIGDLVLLFESSLATSHSSKLEEKWTGPYYIHDTYGNGAYKLRTIDGQVYKKPVHGNSIKKMLSLLQQQIQNERMEGIFTISAKGISYGNKQNPDIEIKPSSILTEAQRIHKKLPLLIEDLQRNDIILPSLEIVVGESWEDQMRILCARLNRNSQDSAVNLQNFYLLGEKINDTNWGDAARKILQEEFPNGHRNLWKTAFRTYTLYSSRGVPNLLSTENITPHVLLKMYENDFKKLIDEAKAIKNREEVDLLALYETFAGAQ